MNPRFARAEFQGEVSHLRRSPLSAVAWGQPSERRGHAAWRPIRCLGGVPRLPATDFIQRSILLAFYMHECCWCTVVIDVPRQPQRCALLGEGTVHKPQCFHLPALVNSTYPFGSQQISPPLRGLTGHLPPSPPPPMPTRLPCSFSAAP